ncbi:MAG TPA: ferrochelatase, partial [Rhodospirillales bacterium]|nr:ferrochelatase [Rhodospirillales bacterium]
VERTVQSIVDKLGIKNLDWVICYQSRVGPLQWLGPSAEDEIGRAARDGKSIVMVPVSFVSEHSETLVELDMEYRKIAGELGVAAYERVPTVSDEPAFMAALKELVVEALKGGPGPAITTGNGARVCAADCPACPLNEEQVDV